MAMIVGGDMKRRREGRKGRVGGGKEGGDDGCL